MSPRCHRFLDQHPSAGASAGTAPASRTHAQRGGDPHCAHAPTQWAAGWTTAPCTRVKWSTCHSTRVAAAFQATAAALAQAGGRPPSAACSTSPRARASTMPPTSTRAGVCSARWRSAASSACSSQTGGRKVDGFPDVDARTEAGVVGARKRDDKRAGRLDGAADTHACASQVLRRHHRCLGGQGYRRCRPVGIGERRRRRQRRPRAPPRRQARRVRAARDRALQRVCVARADAVPNFGVARVRVVDGEQSRVLHVPRKVGKQFTDVEHGRRHAVHGSGPRQAGQQRPRFQRQAAQVPRRPRQRAPGGGRRKQRPLHIVGVVRGERVVAARGTRRPLAPKVGLHRAWRGSDAPALVVATCQAGARRVHKRAHRGGGAGLLVPRKRAHVGPRVRRDQLLAHPHLEGCQRHAVAVATVGAGVYLVEGVGSGAVVEVSVVGEGEAGTAAHANSRLRTTPNSPRQRYSWQQ